MKDEERTQVEREALALLYGRSREAIAVRVAFDAIRSERDEARQRLGEVAAESMERHDTIVAILMAAGVDFDDLNHASQQLDAAGPKPSCFVAALKDERDAAIAERDNEAAWRTATREHAESLSRQLEQALAERDRLRTALETVAAWPTLAGNVARAAVLAAMEREAGDDQ